MYFYNTKQFTDQKWGTENPIMLRDADLGILRLRAYGIYSFHLNDPLVFLRKISGTNGEFNVDSINGQLKRMIVSGLTDLLGELKIPAFDLAANYDEISEKAQQKLDIRFGELGLQLDAFYIENISLPKEVEQMLDKRTEMGLVGSMSQYAQFQAANSIPDAAKNTGGLAGAGVGLGAGAAMGSAFYQTFAQPADTKTAFAQQSPTQTLTCPECGAGMEENSKFCPKCGKPVNQMVKCVKCGAMLQSGSKFCPQCGTAQATQKTCAQCGKELKAEAKFCPECGAKVE